MLWNFTVCLVDPGSWGVGLEDENILEVREKRDLSFLAERGKGD